MFPGLGRGKYRGTGLFPSGVGKRSVWQLRIRVGRVSDGRQLISSGSPFEPLIGFSRAVRVGDRVLVSGTGPIWEDGSFDADPAAQARRVLEIVVAALAEAGASPADVVRTRIYLTDAADIDAVGPVHAEFFAGASPAATAVVVAGLLDQRWRVEIEAEAVLPGRGGASPPAA